MVAAEVSVQPSSAEQFCPEEEALDPYGLQLEAVDAALKSDMFWAYTLIILDVYFIDSRWQLKHVDATCPWMLSHNWGVRGPRYQSRPQSGLGSCPMRGRRARELACGDLQELAAAMTTMAHQKLLPECQGLKAEEFMVVLDDWSRARGYIELMLQLKLSYAQQLPFVLSAVGHSNVVKARKGIAKAMKLYDSCPDAAHHALSHLVLAPCTAMRVQVDAFMTGCSLQELPLLRMLATRMLFIPCVERLVEGLHAKIHRYAKAAPRHSATHMAWSLMRSTFHQNNCNQTLASPGPQTSDTCFPSAPPVC